MEKLRIAIVMPLIQLVFLLHAAGLYAQEDQTVYYGKKYLDINIKSVDKFNERVKHQQTRALSKLKRKEKRFANKLQRKDSAAYVRYQEQSLSFDSISKLNRQDISGTQKMSSRNAAVDSLRRVKGFLEKNSNAASGMGSNLASYDQKLNTQQNQLNHNNYVGDLISKRSKSLQDLSSNSKLKGAGLRSIAKCVYYSRERTKILKQISDEPSQLEERSLEFLQGQDGFDECLKEPRRGTEALGDKSLDVGEMEKLGFQTKRQLSAELKNKIGGTRISGLQQRMGNEVQKLQTAKNGFSNQVKDVKSRRQQLVSTKNNLKNIGQLDKPSFHVNPLRAQPFWRRIEKQYNWQTTRATFEGKPAIFQPSAMFGFRHTPSLTYGLGLATSIGLGQNWNQIKLTFEGVSVRSFAEYKLVFGIGAYAGYEMTFKQAAFDPTKAETNFSSSPHNTNTYQDAVVIGLTKRYKINNGWNGSVQVLYDIWWKEKAMRSPILLRFTTSKNK